MEIYGDIMVIIIMFISNIRYRLVTMWLIYHLDQYRDGSTCVSLWHLFLFTFAICVRSCAVHIPITRPKRK